MDTTTASASPAAICGGSSLSIPASVSIGSTRSGQTNTRPLVTRLRPVVLIIEDTADLRELLTHYLEVKGYEVIQAEDGQEALNLAQQTIADFILVDFDMPFVNGLEVVRQLRQRPGFEPVPVVMTTSHGYTVRDRAVKSGCDEFLPKPIDFDRLDAMLDYFAPITADKS